MKSIKKVLRSYAVIPAGKEFTFLHLAYYTAIWIGAFAVIDSFAVLAFARPVAFQEVLNFFLAGMLFLTGIRGIYLYESGEAASEAKEYKVITPVVVGLVVVSLRYVVDGLEKIVEDAERSVVLGITGAILSLLVRVLIARKKDLKKKDGAAAEELASLRSTLGENPIK